MGISIHSDTRVDREGSTFLVVSAIESGRLLGQLSVSEWETNDSPALDDLWVFRPHRGRGIEGMLLDELVGLAALNDDVGEIVAGEYETNPTRIRTLLDAGFHETWRGDGLVGLAFVVRDRESCPS